MIEYPHVAELLAVLTTVLLAIVQYFEIENKKAIEKLKKEIPPEKDLPRDDQPPKPGEEEVFSLRKDADNLRSKENFCKAEELINYHLWLLLALILFTFLYIFQVMFFQTQFLKIVFNFYLLVSSLALVVLGYLSLTWVEK